MPFIKKPAGKTEKELNGKLVNASHDGRLEDVKTLLAAGADVNYESSWPLRQAAQENQIEVVKFLLKNCADIILDVQALCNALAHGNLEISHLFISHGVDIRGGGDAPLRNAVGLDSNIGIVQTLLDMGADVNAGNGPPLSIAAGYGNIDIMRLLHERGAKIDAMDNDALKSAARMGQPEAMRYLLDHGADATIEDHKILYLAVWNEQWDAVDCLLQSIFKPEKWRVRTQKDLHAAIAKITKDVTNRDPNERSMISRESRERFIKKIPDHARLALQATRNNDARAWATRKPAAAKPAKPKPL